MDAYELMRGVGNLCIGAETNSRYDARRMADSSTQVIQAIGSR